MDKKFTRKLKKNNNSNYILKGLIKNNINQKGGETTVKLQRTQEGLLKALKSFGDINITPNRFSKSIDEINKSLIEIKNKFSYSDNNKTGNVDTSTFTNNLNKFDKFLNDISGGEIKLEYKNDYKLNPLLKVNLDSLKEINVLFDEEDKFKERDQKVSLDNLKKLDPSKTVIEFNERNNKVGINLDKVALPEVPLFNERDSKVGINLDRLSLPEAPKFDERKNTVFIDQTLLKPQIVDINFKEKKERVNLNPIQNLNPNEMLEDINLDNSFYTNKMKKSELFITSNMTSEEKVQKLKRQVEILKKLDTLLKNGIIYYRKDIVSDEIIKKYVTHVKFIKTETKEKELVSGFDEPIIFKEPILPDKDVIINNRKIKIEDSEEYFSEEFISNIYRKKQEGGGLMVQYLETTAEYSKLLKDRNIVNEFKNTVNEYNIIYIQSYYYKLFILKNINRFAKDHSNIIYQYINKETLIHYQKILNKINKYISNPEDEIFTDINSRAATVHAIFYFRYYIIIKKLVPFFNNILEKWIQDNIPDTYKIDVFYSKYHQEAV